MLGAVNCTGDDNVAYPKSLEALTIISSYKYTNQQF